VRLWQYSVYAAFAAAQLAESAPGIKVDESQWERSEHLKEDDVEICKFTHSELGFKACQHWQLPESICDEIQLHHTPVENEIAPDSLNALLFCVQFADSLCLPLLQREDFDGTGGRRKAGRDSHVRPRIQINTT